MVVRKSNFVFVYFPALMLFAQMFKAKTQKSIKALLLWLPFVLLTFTADGVIGRKLSNLAEAFSALTIGVIFLIVANSVNLFTSKK